MPFKNICQGFQEIKMARAKIYTQKKEVQILPGLSPHTTKVFLSQLQQVHFVTVFWKISTSPKK